jgi:protein gp37
VSAKTGIEWCDATWNPVVGCDRVSPGCAHCYAKQLHDQRHTAHLAGKQVAAQYAQPFEVVQLKPERLGYPLSWRKPRRIFVNSVSDLFHDDVPDAYIAAVFGVMGYAPRHTFQVLTKRPARAREVLTKIGEKGGQAWCHGHANELFCTTARNAMLAWDRAYKPASGTPWPLPNVWLGVSVENQRWADERIPILLHTPAAVRFLSCEPLLGPVSIMDAIGRGYFGESRYVDWVIVGGESGKGAREMQPKWARDLRNELELACVPLFFKQWGGERDKRGHDDALLDGVRHVAFPEAGPVVAP